MIAAQAFKRVACAPLLVLGLWIVQLLVAFAGASFVASAVAAAMQDFLWIDEGKLLRSVIELFADHPEVGAAIVVSLTFSLTVGALLWIVASGAIYERLAGRTRGNATLAAAGRWAPSMLALTLWSLIVRALLLLVCGLLSLLWSPLALLMIPAHVLGMLAFDEARARVVFGYASAAHPRTSFGAVLAVLRRPLLLLGAHAITAAQWGFLAIGLMVAGQGQFGAGTLLVVRLLSLLALCLGLLRISLVIGQRPESLESAVERDPAPATS